MATSTTTFSILSLTLYHTLSARTSLPSPMCVCVCVLGRMDRFRRKTHIFPQCILIVFSPLFSFSISGRPEPTVTWFNGTDQLQTAGGIAMGRHVIVNRLEVPQIGRDAYNSTFRCQATNTKMVPAVERAVRLDMLRKCCSCLLCYRTCHFIAFSPLMCMPQRTYNRNECFSEMVRRRTINSVEQTESSLG